MRASRHFRSILRPPESLGHLVEPGNSSAAVIRAVRNEQAEVPSYSERIRYDPMTLEAQSPAPGMTKLPAQLSKKISQMTRDWHPQELRRRVAGLYAALQRFEAQTPAIESIDVEAQITGLFPQNFTSLQTALAEVKKRRPDFVPESVLNVDFGPATGLLAARDVWKMGIANETAVVIGHPRMRRRAKELLGDTAARVIFKNEVPTTSMPKRFDLIIASHQLFQQGAYAEELADSHAQQLAQLLSPNGIVVFVERGNPLGFEATALAREVLLRSKYNFKVIGPCSHSKPCPLQVGLKRRQRARTPGKENWCRFAQSVERPRFAQELKKGQYLAQEWLPETTRGAGGKALRGKGRPGASSSEEAHYSWVALENTKTVVTGASAEVTTAEWPRILKQPLKRHGHVLMEVCAPSGEIEHWTVPRSQGKQAFHDARKADAGDLWALGAKTRQSRGGLRNTDNNMKVKPFVEQPPSKDWWLPRVNPHFKYATHQERVLTENNAEPEVTGFVEVMDSLIQDEGRDEKLLRKEIQGRYNR